VDRQNKNKSNPPRALTWWWGRRRTTRACRFASAVWRTIRSVSRGTSEARPSPPCRSDARMISGVCTRACEKSKRFIKSPRELASVRRSRTRSLSSNLARSFARNTEEVSCRDRIGYASQMDGTSVARSSIPRLKGAIGLPVRISLLPPIRRTLADHNLFNAFTTRDTREALQKLIDSCKRKRSIGIGR
jgi:hypothetical protein